MEIAKTKLEPSKENGGHLILKNMRNIIFPLLKTFRWNLVGISILKLIASLLTFVPPLLLNSLITFIQSKGTLSAVSWRNAPILIRSPKEKTLVSTERVVSDPTWKGIFLAFLMLIFPLAESILNNQYEYRIYRIGMRVRAALTYAIYAKALRLSSQARGQFTTGEIVTLMSVDSQK